jgi:hypothetical protein
LAGLRVPGLRRRSRGRPGGGAGPPTRTAVSHRAANGPADARPAWPSGIATGPARWPCLAQPRPQGAAAPLAGNRKRGRWKTDAVMCHLGYGYVHRHYRGPEQPGQRSRLHTGTTSAISPVPDGTRSPRWQQAPQLADGDIVDLVSVWSDGERPAKGFRAVAYRTPRGCAAAYFPEANVLVPLGSTAERARATPRRPSPSSSGSSPHRRLRQRERGEGAIRRTAIDPANTG